jgi:hypothetical protein
MSAAMSQWKNLAPAPQESAVLRSMGVKARTSIALPAFPERMTAFL